MNNSSPRIWDKRNQHVTSTLLETSAGHSRKMQSSDVNIFLRKRYLMCFLIWSGMIIMFILRLNLSLATVEMTSAKNITMENETLTKKADFDWNSKTQGFVLSIFSVGYLFGPFGGMLAIKFGAVNVFGIGIAVTALLTILTPFSLRTNFWIFILSRMLEGVFESISMACTSDIFARWAPPNERSRIVIFSISGAFVGTIVSYPLCGFVAQKYGWEYIFYVTGAMSLIWYIVWFFLAVENPTTDSFMTRKERDYFKTFTPEALRMVQDKRRYPWKNMFTCIQFWIYMNEIFSYYSSYSFLMFLYPLYLKDAFNTSIQDIGIMSAVPTLSGLGGLLFSAILSDYLRSNGRFTKSSVHKFFIGTGQIASALCFILVALWASSDESVICFTLARFLVVFSDMSYHVMVIDLFYKYAGFVRGFGVTATGVAFFLNPILMGFMISDHTKSSWNRYFLFLSVFNIWSILVYYIFGSAETLEWAAIKADDKSDEEKVRNKCPT